jgi:hypothetical protein
MRAGAGLGADNEARIDADDVTRTEELTSSAR